ncbi:MAG: nucleoside deaminase [Bacillus sp. (in: firmicutes)]
MNHLYFLQKTIDLAQESIEKGGGPFAAIIVDQQGKIVGVGQNSVTKSLDPTAHAEVEAIRQACKNLNSYQLDNCTLYTSCEPCPMCLGAIYWARPAQVYYAATQKDAAAVGFDDAFIYEEIDKEYSDRTIPFHSLSILTKNKPFEVWSAYTNKVEY